MAHNRVLSLIRLVYQLPDGHSVTVLALKDGGYQIGDSAGIVEKFDSLQECAQALANKSGLGVHSREILVGPLRAQLGGLEPITD